VNLKITLFGHKNCPKGGKIAQSGHTAQNVLFPTEIRPNNIILLAVELKCRISCELALMFDSEAERSTNR